MSKLYKLHKLCVSGNVRKVKKYTKCQYSYNKKTGSFEPANINLILNFCLRSASEGGNLKLAKYIIKKGATGWECALYSACKGGHFKVVKFLIKKGASWWNYGLKGACEGCHFKIVKIMIKKGANFWDWGLRELCEGPCEGPYEEGRFKLINFIIDKIGCNTMFGYYIKNTHYIINTYYIHSIKQDVKKENPKLFETLKDNINKVLHKLPDCILHDIIKKLDY